MKQAVWWAVLAGALFALARPGLGADADDLKDRVDRAVARGVKYLKGIQGKDGVWAYSGGLAAKEDKQRQQDVGATALAGLTLLECDVPRKDEAIQKAAAVVRANSPGLTYTYAISLAVMFLDRLGDPADVPQIESLTLRLMAGQSNDGGWSYNCPPISESELRRLTGLAAEHNELVAKGTIPERRNWAGQRRSLKELPREVVAQIVQVARQGAAREGGDNSNTQFASLALWIGRRQGLPVDAALAKVEAGFRETQFPSGGWNYRRTGAGGGPQASRYMQQMQQLREFEAKRGMDSGTQPKATMTCAGLIGVAVGNGAVNDRIRAKNPKAKKVRISAKDPAVRGGLQALAPCIGPKVERLEGQSYYFFWSLERVGTIYGLDKIGGKDWYAWGAGLILANQAQDGSWSGQYGGGGVDTCFALLFLRRSNLVPDLSASLRAAGGEIGLRAGGVGGKKLTVGQDIIGGLNTKGQDEEQRRRPPARKPAPPPSGDDQGAAITRLSTELVRAAPERQEELIARYQLGRGVVYTEALAGSIPLLKGDAKTRARAALAARLTRMSAQTLRDKLQDDNLEVRRAAALACGKKKSRAHVPDLIARLNDPELPVVLAAHQALVAITGQDFGPDAEATRAELKDAVAKWQAWWKGQAKD